MSVSSDARHQVYPAGLRVIRADKRINEWKTPQRKSIVRCAVNQRQVVIALVGGDLIYFELDAAGQLMETEKRELGQDVACLDIPPVPAGRTRASFLAAGLHDNTVRLFSLDADTPLQPVGMQAVPAVPTSIAMVELGAGSAGADDTAALMLAIGLTNGVLTRTQMDPITGALTDTRMRFVLLLSFASPWR
jgi:splicing factor 3B subunit 3